MFETLFALFFISVGLLIAGFVAHRWPTTWNSIVGTVSADLNTVISDIPGIGATKTASNTAIVTAANVAAPVNVAAAAPVANTP